MQSVRIGNGVTNIDRSAFSGCEKLKSISIPDGLTSISNLVFAQCRDLQNISIPNGVTSIGASAFYNCEKLKSITIPNTVTNIDSYAFYGCTKLQDISIPDSITNIADGTFEYCQNLQNISIPNSVTSIGEKAFKSCDRLKNIIIPDSVTSISLIFGESFPKNHIEKIREWYPRMTDALLKKYVLNPKTWSVLDEALQAEIWNVKYSKALMKFFMPLMNESFAEYLTTQYLTKAASALSAAECKKISAFMITFQTKISDDSLQSLYEVLLAQKNGKKVVEEISKDLTLSAKLRQSDSKAKELTETEKKLFAFMDSHKISVAEITQKLKDYYSLTPKDIPAVQDTEGKPAAELAMLYLLTAHETVSKYDDEVVAQHKQPGISPEATEIISLLDPSSLQAALRELANKNLGITGRSKKMYLAYPICRYADEALMEELTKKVPSWRSSVSGNEAPPLRTFREANLYSETRAAMLLAEKYKELNRYAVIRGTTADLLRDNMLSNIGLSKDGKKTYSLGNQTVTAILQKDLSFLIQLENGKTAKSLPKKDADPTAYAMANADFAEMKKNAKKIVKNRQNILFEEFLGGKSRSADEWKAAYTENPLLRAVASLLVWEQGKNTFVLTENGTITSDEKSYEIGKTKISLAHPMEMTAEDLSAWQSYFVKNGLKQPFEQIWEPAIDKDSIKKDRYKGCMIPYYRFTGKNKHGISVTDEDFHNIIYIEFKDLVADMERIDWERHYIDPNHRFEITNITFKKYTRMANHIIAYLDRITIYDRIAKDDVSILNMLDGFTLAQIMEFIRIASENNAVNVTAMLLNYKNENFPDFDPLAEFSLDFDD